MEQEAKKISFGFSKSTKKPLIFQKPVTKKNTVQLIDCLEAQTIKIKGAVEKVKGPLVIPMVESSGSILERRRELKLKREIKVENDLDEKPEAELTADEIAARELIKDAKNADVKREGKIYTLPVVTENVIEIEGKEEPTLDDYESIPISDYGMAMLRGMGWAEGAGIGKNKSSIKVAEPTLRPKGMGLGANKGANQEYSQKPAVDKNGEELILKKGTYAKIIDGKQKGNYCEVQGFDDEAGRVIVKTTLQGLILSLNEFLVKPVTKEEYIKSSKVINNAKYEEYKSKESKAETGNSSKEKDTESDRHKTSSSKQKTYSVSDDSEDEHKSRRKTYDNGRDEDRYRKKSKKKYRSSSHSSIESSSTRRKYREKSKKKYSSEESDSSRRKYRERARSSSVSDREYKKHNKKSKKKSKDKSKYRDNSESDSDKYSSSRKTHKSSKHKHRHEKDC